MNKQPNPDRALLHFILRAQQIAQQDGRSDKGYAMLMVSMISIALFSMLAAYMTMTNLNKSSTSAYVDGTNTFYVAESGLNRRAQQLREKFLNYSLPSGLSPGTTAASQYVSPTNITNCFTIAADIAASATNDFECRNFAYNHTDSSKATVKKDNDGTTQSVSTNQQVGYSTYTFVADKTIYTDTARTTPSSITIPISQAYGGLNALEYWYTVYSTAAKPDPLNPTSPVQQSNAKTVLQMDFRSRVVPLFQFAVFYDGDLEMNSSSDMTIGGRVHTNANLYVQPNTTTAAITTTFLGPVTAVGDIYNRVDSTGMATHNNSTRVLMTGNDCATGTCAWWPNFATGTTIPFTSTQLAVFGSKVKSGVFDNATRRLNTPPPGFLRKRNYFKSSSTTASTRNEAIGEYFAKADMRLEMVPDRGLSPITGALGNPNSTVIPFNFTSVTTVAGAGSTCTTTVPARDTLASGVPTLASDPAATYIDPDRNNPNTANALTTTLHCNVFTKGQLQSLRQPVMVLTSISQTAALSANETTTLRLASPASPALPALPTGLSTTVTAALVPGTAPNATQKAILHALRVAIASQPSPITLDSLNQPFSSNTAIQAEFGRLLDLIPTTVLPADRILLTANAVTPNQIAAIGGAWFMPAPIQRVQSTNAGALTAPTAPRDPNNLNDRNSGFYDGRERRWITVLQTNIASLSVWNRDGLYVESGDTATDTRVTLPYAATNATKETAFALGVGANSTDGLAFDRASTIPTGAKGLQVFGLGAREDGNNKTEGGLVFHATVSDDLNGDGTIDATNDITLDTANPIKKTDAIGGLVDADNRPMAAPGLTIDYPRKYRNGGTYQSPFGFVFNGGDYLPGALTLVTDQAIYTQGNFNNNNAPQARDNTEIAANPADANRLPASIIGDTITILSNQCINNTNTSAATVTNHLGVSVSQIKCGIPSINSGSVNVPDPTGGFITSAARYNVNNPTAVNAAFLSNTDRSDGNLGAGRSSGGATRFSGAINNYIRMLENWGGATGQQFNYTGSFVSLGTPLEYSGVYSGGPAVAGVATGVNNSWYYNIPRRNFNFDTNFNTFTSLPPLPPRAIYLKQDVFKRTYN
jgi:hypothetical protein